MLGGVGGRLEGLDAFGEDGAAAAQEIDTVGTCLPERGGHGEANPTASACNDHDQAFGGEEIRGVNWRLYIQILVCSVGGQLIIIFSGAE